VEWLLVPMPRLEIESIADFKVLYEIGALTPDMSMKLSRVLVGDNVLMSKKQQSSRAAKPPGDADKEGKTSPGETDNEGKTKRKRNEESENKENKKDPKISSK